MHYALTIFVFSLVSRNESVCLVEVFFNWFVTTFNRSVPVVISVFRYVYVFHWETVLSTHQKKSFQMKCLSYLFGSSTISSLFGLIFAGSTKRYMRCMGRVEQYFYSIPFFLEEPVGGHLTILPIWNPFRLALIFLYLIFLVIVPFAYIRIFLLRKEAPNKTKDKQKRNIVSFWYNMAIWLMEGFATVGVSNEQIVPVARFDAFRALKASKFDIFWAIKASNLKDLGTLLSYGQIGCFKFSNSLHVGRHENSCMAGMPVEPLLPKIGNHI